MRKLNEIKLSNVVPEELKKWVNNVNNLDVSSVLNMYDNNAILLATFEALLIGKNQIKSYFDEFLDKSSMKCEIIENFTKVNSKSDIIDSNGIYQFTFKKENKTETVIARYTFITFKGLICSHHSSVVPT